MKGSDIMGKNYFTNEQVEFLRKNKYVKHVSNKGITYSLEFKELFIKEYGLKNPAKIFEDAGFELYAKDSRSNTLTAVMVPDGFIAEDILFRTLNSESTEFIRFVSESTESYK